MAQREAIRPAVRYEAQAGPSEGSRSDVEAKTTAWVGAFERVVGDHEEEQTSRSKQPSRKAASSNPTADQTLLGPPSSYATNGLSNDNADPSQLSGSSNSNADMPGQHRSPLKRPVDSRQRSKSKVSAPRSTESDASLATVPRLDEKSIGDSTLLGQGTRKIQHKESNRSLQAANSSGSHAVAGKSAAQLRSYGSADGDRDDEDARSEASSSAARTKSGPTLVEAFARGSQDQIVFDDLYTNHAPGLLPVRLRNTHAKAVLIKLEGNLGSAVTFMRRRKPGVKNELEKIVWPTNTLRWAKADGLSPASLRELRAVSANLETSDALILEAGASTDIFVIFRPSVLESKHIRQPLNRQQAAGRSEAVSLGPQRTSVNPASTANSSAESLGQSDSADHDPKVPSPAMAATTAHSPTLSQRNATGSVCIKVWPLLSSPPSASHSRESEMPAVATVLSKAIASGTGPGAAAGLSIASVLAELPDVPSQVIEMPLCGRFCRPEFQVNVRQPCFPPVELDTSSKISNALHKQGVVTLDFGDVAIGEDAETEMTLINASEIDCMIQGRIDCSSDIDGPPATTLFREDGTTPFPLVSPADDVPYRPNTLSPRSSIRVKMHLKARDEHSGNDLEELVTFTNLHDVTNSVKVLVKANVLSQGRDTPLTIMTGDTLDFGDCSGGHWARQLLILKNQANYSLDAALNAQKGYEVTFHLAREVVDSEQSPGDEMSVGASAASSEGGGSAASDSGINADASSAVSGGDLERRSLPPSPETSSNGIPFEQHHGTAMELARTPTHHATAPGVEPPTFDLASSSFLDVEKTPMTLTPYAHPPAPKHEPETDEDCDGSSVASQAGSRPSSPVQASTISELDSHALSEAPSSAYASSGAKKRVGAQNSILAWRDANAITGDVASSSQSRPPSTFSMSSTSWREGGSAGQVDEESASVGSEASQSAPPSIEHAADRRSPSAARRHVSARTEGSAASSGLRAIESKDHKQLEDLTVRPGEEVRIIVAFRPLRNEEDETFSAGRLVENIFRIIVDYVKARSNLGHPGSRLRGGRERRVVMCRTRTCTSFITVSPKEVDFGDVNVGSRKSSQIVVTNQSDLSARVDLRFVSKVLSTYRDEMAVPAGQSVHLTVDYSPRRVNLSYSKQITVANLLNRRNDQIIEVRGKNVDLQRISFHSLFYRILTPNGSNFLEFGDVNINSSRVRTFAIENTSRSDLTLELTGANPEDIQLFVKAERAAQQDVSGIPERPTAAKGYEDTEPGARVVSANADASKNASQAKGVELKERFLESISSDVPAHIRLENTSWRTAQKLSHFHHGAAPPTAAMAATKEGQLSGLNKAKQPVNMVSALKKGGKGRNTMTYGKSVTFKDRTLLQAFEYVDLASGPPLVAKRISIKSKCFQTLEQLATASSRPKAKVGETAEVKDADLGSAPSNGALAGEPPATPQRKAQGASDVKAKSAIGKLSEAGSNGAAAKTRSPALTGKRKVQQTILDPSDVSTLSLDELLAALESQPSALTTLFFNSPQAEEKHVRTEINLQRELRRVIESKQLLPLNMLTIPPGQDRQVVAIYCPNGSTRPHVQSTARKQDSRIFLRLVDFDNEAVRASQEFSRMADLDKDELPIRDLMVRTTTCRALLELGQPHINFGQMEKGETKTRKILIHNRSEWAARYCIRKSGSIASGDIKLASGRYGVVSAHGKREVEFIFSPSLTGPFQEKLVIENVADRDRDLTVSLKANVRKKPNFSVEPAIVDFAECLPGKLTNSQTFSISNTTSKHRTFVVAVDTSELRQQRTIMDLVFSASEQESGALSKEEETHIAEEIEHISQKLKIATRKGQDDKIKKYEGKLAELSGKSSTSAAVTPTTTSASGNPSPLAEKPGSALTAAAGKDGTSAESSAPDADLSQPSQNQVQTQAQTQASNASANPNANVNAANSASRLKRVSSTVTIGLAPNQSKRISLRLRTRAVQTALTAEQFELQQQQKAINGSSSTDSNDALAAQRASTSGSSSSGGEDVRLGVLIHEVKNQDETRVVTVLAKVLWGGQSSPPTSQNRSVDEVQTPAQEVGVKAVTESLSGMKLSDAGTEADAEAPIVPPSTAENGGVKTLATAIPADTSMSLTSPSIAPSDSLVKLAAGTAADAAAGATAVDGSETLQETEDPLPLEKDGESVIFSSDTLT